MYALMKNHSDIAKLILSHGGVEVNCQNILIQNYLKNLNPIFFHVVEIWNFLWNFICLFKL